MLKIRVITALIGFVIAVIAITSGGFLFNSLIGILALLGWREFVKMIGLKASSWISIWGYISLALLFISISAGTFSVVVSIAIFSMIVLWTGYLFYEGEVTTIGLAHWGLLYVSLGFGSMIILREASSFLPKGAMPTFFSVGEALVWMILLCIWASDTFAYFAGRFFGRHHIVPAISPNKTLEGFVGGFIGCVLVALIFGALWGIPLGHTATIGVLLAIFSPLGDLVESKLKRRFGIKDSGVLLPGHGGVLDRFDSLLLAVPVVLAYLILL